MMVNNIPASFVSPRRILMGPGPSAVNPEVLAALAQPTVGHLDPEFLQLMNEVQEMLRKVFQTSNDCTLAISGTGSAGMEACLVNLIEPGNRVLIGVNGVFGTRMAEVARRAGAEVQTIERPFGEVFTPDDFEQALDEFRPKLTGIVHAETSTGVLQPMPEISRLVRESGSLLLLDCVTSLGGVPVEIDEWGVDAAYSGTQKCLSCPPGLSPVTFSPRAEQIVRERQSAVQSWYLDLRLLRNYWSDQSRAYHHTAPINMNFALHAALIEVLEEGLRPRFERHRFNSQLLTAGIKALGLDYAVGVEHRLPVLHAIRIPEGVSDQTVRRSLLEEFGLEIGGGLGPMAGKTWRVGLMGASSSPENVLLFLAALENCLVKHGHGEWSGAGVTAANRILAQRRS